MFSAIFWNDFFYEKSLDTEKNMKKVIKILDCKIFTYHDSRVHNNSTLLKIHTGFFFLPYPWKQKMRYNKVMKMLI